jgi:hypothetical protein
VQPALDGTHLAAVAWTGRRFVAAGDRDGTLVVADSPDGRTWHVQPSLPMHDVSDHVDSIHGIAAGPAGVVIIGSTVGKDRTAVAAWYSPDGLTWTVAPEQRSLGGGSDRTTGMNAIAAVDDGWIAVGEEGPANIECVACWISAVTWTSNDGLRWTRSAEGGDLAEAALTGITAGGHGYVGVGTALDTDPWQGAEGLSLHGVVWTSPDGRSWSRVPDEDLFHAASGVDAPAVAMAGGRLVAVGAITEESGTTSIAWWSDDGRTWSRVHAPQLAEGPTGGVVAVRDGVMAVGTRSTGISPGCPTGTWESPDGTAWSCAVASTGRAGFIARGIASSPDAVVVVGSGETEPCLPMILVHALR